VSRHLLYHAYAIKTQLYSAINFVEYDSETKLTVTTFSSLGISATWGGAECADLRFLSPQPDYSLHRETSDMVLAHRAASFFFIPLFSFVPIVPTADPRMLSCQLLWSNNFSIINAVKLRFSSTDAASISRYFGKQQQETAICLVR